MTAVRYYVFRVFNELIQRGEVEGKEMSIDDMRRILFTNLPGPSFRYDHSWKRKIDAPLKKRILKAARLLSFGGPFTVAELKSLGNTPERSYLDLLIRNLVKGKYLTCVGSRRAEKGRGREYFYRVTDLSKFRVDLL